MSKYRVRISRFLLALLVMSECLFAQTLTKFDTSWDVVDLGNPADYRPILYSPNLEYITSVFDAYIAGQAQTAAASKQALESYSNLLNKYNIENKLNRSYLDRPVTGKEQALRQAAVKRLENLTQESIDWRGTLPKDFEYRYSIEQQRLAIAQSIFSRENLPSRAQRLSLLDMAKSALDFYKQYKNDEFEGNFYLTSAGLLIDLSIGKIAELPISLYQGVTGKEFLTGRELSAVEQVGDLLNVASVGNFGRIKSVVKAIDKLSDALPDRLKGTKKGREFIEGIVDEASKRTPTTGGKWTGERGNSRWISNDPEFIQATDGKGVEFKDNFADFSPYSKGQKKFDNLSGNRRNDRSLYYKEMIKDGRAENEEGAAELLRKQGVALHHVEDGKTLQEIPTAVHKIPHMGGASVIDRVKGIVGGGDDE